MRSFRFLTFLLLTAATVVGIMAPLPWDLFPLFFIFVGIPVGDLIFGLNRTNPSAEDEQKLKKPRAWAPPLILYAVTHFAVLVLAATEVRAGLSWPRFLILTVSVGLSTGGLGITVAHELCHKKEKWARVLADFLLASVAYQHFAVEHVRGHHFLVATEQDPASARKNENVYRFFLRTIPGGFAHALTVDRKDVLKGVCLFLGFAIAAALGGPPVLLMFLLQALVAILLVELANYVEHYGLTRRPLANGRYEKVLPIHSWNSAHRFSNSLLFHLQRHSDHHALATLPYTLLKNHDEAPQLPSGYPAMIVLALTPPLWFQIMNPKVQAWEERWQRTPLD
jgi:alkane 1-monooxygenase